METMSWMSDLNFFIKVAELNSYSKAADVLQVSKSHISKKIKKLETELNTNLFVRSTRHVQLSEAGSLFYQKCKVSIEQLQIAKDQIHQKTKIPSGQLRITSAGIFGEEIISEVVIQLAKKYPRLSIELNFSTEIVDLIEKKFDIAIRFGNLKDSSLYAQKIGSRREYVCVSKKYIDTHEIPKNPSQLKNHNCLGSASRWSFKMNDKKTLFNVAGNFNSNNPRVIAKAVNEGLGIAKLPGAYVFEDIRKGKLISILEPYNEGLSDIWIVTPVKFEKNVNVNVFITELKNLLKLNYQNVLF